jgi:hypothetical protein
LWPLGALAPEAAAAEAETRALALASSASAPASSPAPAPAASPAPAPTARVRLYVLCHDDASEAAARSGFGGHEWARVLRLAEDEQTHLFEGEAFARALPRLEGEWGRAGAFDFVGTVSYKLAAKANASALAARVASARAAREDVVFFLPGVGDPFGGHAPALRAVFRQLLAHPLIALPPLQPEEHAWAFCSFWMASPPYLRAFLRFFRERWLPALEAHPRVWDDAVYRDATLAPARLRALSGGRVAHYPLHAFLGERVASVFFARATRARLGCSRKLVRADFGASLLDWALRAGVMTHIAAAQGTTLRVGAAALGGPPPGSGWGRARLSVVTLSERCELEHESFAEGAEWRVPLFSDAINVL